MKAVLEGGGWEMSPPPPSNKQPLEERNGAALFGGGVALSTHQAAQGTSNLRARCQKGAPRQPSMLAGTYMLPEAFLWRASIFPSRGRYMTHRKVSFAQAHTY